MSRDINNPCRADGSRGTEGLMPAPIVIFSDCHGTFKTLMALLAKVHAVYPDARPYSLGDNVDRGPRSREVVEWLMKNNIQTCAGNHEDLALAYSEHAKLGYKAKCARFYERNVWRYNGGDGTLKEWGSHALPKNVLDWMVNLPPYFIIDQESGGRKLLLSHTGYGLDADKGNWMAALWGRHGYDLFDFVHDKDGEPIDDGYFRVFGHSRCESAIVTDTYINIDTACAYGGKLTAFVWPTREIFEHKNID